MNYDINFIRVEKMNMSELRDIEGVVGDAQVTGSLEVKTLIVHWDVDAKLSSERSRKLIKIAPSLANIADADEFRLAFEWIAILKSRPFLWRSRWPCVDGFYKADKSAYPLKSTVRH